MPRIVSSAFVCAECGRSFIRKPDFNRHALIHKPDARRFRCDYPGCNHSTLQRSNLKTHYDTQHLKQRLHQCHFYGCNNTYGDPSALIRHEKTYHGYFRKAHKAYKKLLSGKKSHVKSELAQFPSGNGACEAGTPTPSLEYLRGAASSSPASSAFPATPSYLSAPFSQGLSPLCLMESYNPQSTDEFLHEMIPELFPDPQLIQKRNAIPTGSPFDAQLGLIYQQSSSPYPFTEAYVPYFGSGMPLNFPAQSWSQ